MPSLVVVAFVLLSVSRWLEDGRAWGMRAGGRCTRVSLQVPKRVFLCQSPVCLSVLPSLLLWVSLSASYLIPLHPSPPSWALPGPLAEWGLATRAQSSQQRGLSGPGPASLAARPGLGGRAGRLGRLFWAWPARCSIDGPSGRPRFLRFQLKGFCCCSLCSCSVAMET